MEGLPTVDKKPQEQESEEEVLPGRRNREFASTMQQSESGMIGGILGKFNKLPVGVKRGLMMLATVGVLLPAKGAFGAEGVSPELWHRYFGKDQEQSSLAGGATAESTETKNKRAELDAEFHGEVLKIQTKYDRLAVDAIGKDPHHSVQAAEDIRVEQVKKEEEARLRWLVRVWAEEQEHVLHETGQPPFEF